MRSLDRSRLIAFLGVALFTAGCGGGGGGGSSTGTVPTTPTSAPTACPAGYSGTPPTCSTPTSNSGSATTSTSQSVTASLPAANGVSGSLQIPKASVVSALSVTTSSTPPNGAVAVQGHLHASARQKNSSVNSALLYITLTPAENLTLNGSIGVTASIANASSGTSYYLAQFINGAWYTVSGPVSVSNGQVTLPAGTTSILMYANLPTMFALYAGGTIQNPQPSIKTSYPIAASVGNTQLLILGPDGNLWTTDNTTSGSVWATGIDRISPTGVVTRFPLTHAPSTQIEISGITFGSDGNLWFTVVVFNSGQTTNYIGKMTPAGDDSYILTHDKNLLGPIVLGPDGNVWFAGGGATSLQANISKITPSGVITDYVATTNGDVPRSIVTGADGNLWFVSWFAISSVTPSGTVTAHTLTVGNGSGFGGGSAVVGPDGNFWIAVNAPSQGSTPGGAYFLKVSPTGTQLASYPMPPNLMLGTLVVGKDGRIWSAAGNVVAISTSGQYVGYTSDSLIGALLPRSDGDFWFIGQSQFGIYGF